ncbi:tetratricopeptide repeat protein [Phenylobacterium sp.]|uniref:tetratricopeptide repeat protein n=1 Tax=Phenylobacterium sp. TaxID=1871053 RepID=UPI0025DBB5D2|nr:tetratricopeptide repeat protein [Phenylobacterium sp.]MCA6346980.1 tetratricopeptide repeat protein [Phenylobacterium sp.]MCA6355611.1 tetratricopeptide repeat protein [Phenylobacterium sp.]MCA6360445.1 tetratricopeptide repeat protein [Phenylobacterium sp.]
MIAIFRQWSWDEEDRSLSVPGSERRVRVDNDLTNEGLFSIAALFLLIPPLLYRLQTSGTPLLGSPEAYGMAGYTAFVLEQFRQALPVLSNVEVYGDAPLLGVEPVSGLGRHVAFGLRLTFELVLIAGLLLSIEVSRRIVIGRDLREQIASLIDSKKDQNRTAVDHLFELARRGRTAARDLLQQCALGEVDVGKPTKASQSAAADGLVRLAELRPDYGMVLLTVAIDGYRRLRAEASDDPSFRSDVTGRLGVALYALGEREGGEAGKAHLEEAVSVFRATLEVHARDAMPSYWAMTQNNLANALKVLGGREGGQVGKARLEEAVSAYRAALEVRTRDTEPSDWAGTQNNLANALQVLGKREGGEAGKARLEEAVSAYRAALEVYTRASMPSDWAMTQNNLAIALYELGEREGGEAGKARLEEAVSAFRAALMVYTRDAMPSYWARTQSGLEVALKSLREWPVSKG